MPQNRTSKHGDGVPDCWAFHTLYFPDLPTFYAKQVMAVADTAVQTGTIKTKIPARIDRLPWSGFHWRILIGLGTVWILDGLEVTMVGNVASRMTEDGSGIDFTSGDAGLAGAIYIVGACAGALVFGHITDRAGRKKLFMITLAVYIAATFVTAFAWAPWFFFLARFFAGSGIGGEYAAINSAIDELIPARVRGNVDLIINGTYWAGAAGGAALALILLNEAWFPAWLGWRLGFGLGVVLGLLIILVRRHVPESPRWLFIHGRDEEAEALVDKIEADVEQDTGQELDSVQQSLTVRQRTTISFREIAKTAFKLYPGRAILGIALFVGQAFIYNGITFDLGTLYTGFYDVSSGFVPVFFIIFALGNFLGPVLLGRLFDTVGRKPMISGTYIGSALMSIPLAFIFFGATGGPWLLELFIVLTFFLASAGASAAYLTVSEIFPMETRALAIAFFYAIGTGLGGIIGPLLFGQFINSGERSLVMAGFFIGAAIMAIGGLAEIFLGVKAERADLESIATPLTAEEADEQQSSGAGADDGSSDAAAGSATQQVSAARRRASESHEAAEQTWQQVSEHRAEAHEAAADSNGAQAATAAEATDNGADWRAVASSLAEIAELHARQLEYEAAAAEELANPERSGARYRAEAAEQRARDMAEQAEAHASESDAESDQHQAQASAAAARARSREQLAQAEIADAVADAGGDAADVTGADDFDFHDDPPAAARARAAAHRAWSEVDEQRAAAFDARAAGDAAEVERRETAASVAEENALAAAERVEAAQHADAAAGLRRERDENEEESREQQAAANEQQQQLRARDERIRQRLLRQQSGRQGLRRWRPGPSAALSRTWTTGAAPMRASEEARDQEIETIARALAENGPLRRSDLARAIGARYWGPGRFAAALDVAVDEHRVVRVSRGTFGPAPENDSDQ